MSVDVRTVSGGRPVIWSWCGTCQRGGSNKYYGGIVVQNADGTYDGLCFGAAIGHAPRIYPQVTGVDQATAIRAVERQCNTKKREYVDNPSYLTGVNAQTLRSHLSMPQPTTIPLNQIIQRKLQVVWPMLAPNQTPEKKLPEMMADGGDWIAEEKYDGMRLLGHITEEGTRYTSRGTSVKDPTRPIEKTSELQHLNIKWPYSLYGTIFDGELIAEGKISSDVSGTLHAQDGRDKSGLVMVLYDLPYYQGRDLTDSGEKMPFHQRRKLLEQVYVQMRTFWGNVRELNETPFPFRLAPQFTAGKEEKLKQILASGGEGIMLKHKDGLYVQGKRPANTMYKVKKFTEDDVVIIGYTAGKGKYAGQIGAIRFGQYVPMEICMLTDIKPVGKDDLHPNLQRKIDDGISEYYLCELGQTSGMTDELRRELTQNGDAYIGRVMSIKAMERLKSGAFRHPQFQRIREEGDKSPFECIWEGDE